MRAKKETAENNHTAQQMQIGATGLKEKSRHRLLIHSANPQSRPIGTIVSPHVVCQSPLLKSSVAKQKNNVRYWRGCGSGRMDH